MINKKSGQAALEFLMTYGWAILVVLVAVGALAYFGVLSPDKFLPAKCTLSAGVGCVDHKVQGTINGGNGLITVRLTNSLGFDIQNVNVSTGGCGYNDTATTTLTNGASATYYIGCSVPLTGSKYNAQLNVSYVTTDTGIAHKNQGQITTRIE